MPVGYLLEGDSYVGVEIRVEKDAVIVDRAWKIPVSEFQEKNVVVGIDLKDFFIKSISLPISSKKELLDAIQLQISYHLPYDPSEAYISYQLKKSKKDALLLITAVERKKLIRPKAVIPAPLALYLWGLRLGLLKPNKSYLLVFIAPERVYALAVSNLEIVFMRDFPLTEDLIIELKLSSQEVFLKKERCVIKPDEIILFSSIEPDEELDKKLSESFPDTRFTKIDISMIISQKDGNDVAGLFIPCGISLYPQFSKRVKNWNVAKKDIQYHKSIIRGLIYTLPLWPLFLTGYYLGEINVNANKIKAIKGRLASLRPVYSKLLQDESQIRDINNFLDTVGNDVNSPKIWLKIFEQLTTNKPDQLWLTSISGRTESSILVGGKASSYDSVTTYISRLNKVKAIKDLFLLFTQRGRQGEVSFQISFKIDPYELLSEEEQELETEAKEGKQ